VTLELTEAQCREIGRLRSADPSVKCAIIGAVALNHHVPLPRTTGDVDLVLALDVRHLRELLEKLGWEQHPRVKQRWTATQFIADVLPASPSLIVAGKVALDDDDREMSLAGFDLLYKHAEVHPLPDGQDVMVANLPTIVVLKICAWLDRPHDRRKDLNDLGTILVNALGNVDERRWSGTLPEDFDQQSPYFVGREVGSIIGGPHRQFIDRFLEKVLSDESSWLDDVGRGFGNSTIEPRVALDAFHTGLGRQSPSQGSAVEW
jgi:predicted nucleotidyltransferase